MIRFVCVGVVNTLAGYAIILVAQFVLGLHPVASNALGYLGGFVVSFVLHRSFTFRSKGSVHRQLSGFAAAAMLCWSLNMLVLHLGLRMAGWLPALAQAVAVSSYTVLFFALTRYAVFHEEKRHGI
ncbi:MAG: GtrA family protein [Rhodoferax sp.]|nr:GtrA family protein [Rhodoferax sp.]